MKLHSKRLNLYFKAGAIKQDKAGIEMKLWELLKRICISVFRLYWSFKTTYLFFMLGYEGLTEAIQKMPKPFIIKTIKRFGGIIGKDTVINNGLILHRAFGKKPFKNLKIGEGVYIGRCVLLDLTDEVILEDYTALGAFCQIWTHVGDYTVKLYDGDYNEKKGAVIIKKSTICYSGSIISPGIEIGPRARIGAGSVVVRDITANIFAAGNPVKEIRVSQKRKQ